jgi:RimJ/RimL family protein N-acetyltransferase
MAGGGAADCEVVLETDRLILRPLRVAEAAVQRELWLERDPRVPPHRRIDADGRPTVADLEESIRVNPPASAMGLLAVERKAAGDVVGYCGLVDSGRGADGEPELAFELLRRAWRLGYATEASLAVLDWRDPPGTNASGLRSGTGTPLLAECWSSSGSQRPPGSTVTRGVEPLSSSCGTSDR